MTNGRHLHRCHLCKDPFECGVITHCPLDSDDPDESQRPECYKCQQEIVAKIEKLYGNAECPQCDLCADDDHHWQWRYNDEDDPYMGCLHCNVSRPCEESDQEFL